QQGQGRPHLQGRGLRNRRRCVRGDPRANRSRSRSQETPLMPDRAGKILPIIHQAPLPLERLILAEPPDAEAVPMDVLFVGGGPAGLAGAIALARMVKADNHAGGDLGDVQIGVLEKAGALGEHSLSGAAVDPIAFRALFPELEDKDFPFRGPVSGERVYYLTESRAMRIPT